MSCKNRSALDVLLVPPADRKISQRTWGATESSKRPMALLVSGVIFGALLGFAQPVKAETPDRLPAVNSDVYSTLADFVKSKDTAGPMLVVADARKPALVTKGPADYGLYAKGDPQTCLGCHGQDPHIMDFLKFSKMARKGDPKSPMGQGGCESCHGPSASHVLSRSKGGNGEPAVVFNGLHASPVEARNEVCLGCHEGGLRINWIGSEMERQGVACTNCHRVHSAEDPVRVKKTQPEVCFACHAQQRAESFEYSHHPIREGLVVCSDCHNPHGSPAPHMLKEFTVNQTCYNCHADKRGPMLWEHQPVREDCTNCHTPHGSVEARLMKENMGFMCSSCHSAISNSSGGAFGGHGSLPGNVQGTSTFNSALGNQRLCLNCHSQIHGSNSPNGAYFIR
ncbi:MAG: DmsE family decaheme c-type cytochrome [Beijerinckiaceae bacterium]